MKSIVGEVRHVFEIVTGAATRSMSSVAVYHSRSWRAVNVISPNLSVLLRARGKVGETNDGLIIS